MHSASGNSGFSTRHPQTLILSPGGNTCHLQSQLHFVSHALLNPSQLKPGRVSQPACSLQAKRERFSLAPVPGMHPETGGAVTHGAVKSGTLRSRPTGTARSTESIGIPGRIAGLLMAPTTRARAADTLAHTLSRIARPSSTYTNTPPVTSLAFRVCAASPLLLNI